MSRREREIDDGGTPIRMADAIASIARAFVIAKSSMDEVSAELAKKYSEHEILSTITLPFFSISDVTIQLKFVVRETRDNETYISIDSQTLEKSSQNSVSQIDIKLTPQPVKAYKTAEGGKILFSANQS